MNLFPAEPHPSEPIRATLIRDIIRCLREISILQGPGYTFTRGPNGTSLNILPPEPSDKASDIGCFAIRRADTPGQITFANPYYVIGSRLYRASPDELEPKAYKDCIVYLEIDLEQEQPEAKIKKASDYNDLQTTQSGEHDKAIFPLYEFGEDGEVLADLRNIPSLSGWEFTD